MGQQIINLQNKIKSLEREAAQQERQIDNLSDEIGDINNKVKDVQGQRESVQRQYNGLAQSLISVQEELTNSRTSLDQTMVSLQQKEADSAREIERLRSDQALARQMSATTEATIETLRHQLSVVQEEVNRQTQPTSSNVFRYRGPLDSPATPMDIPNRIRYRDPADTPPTLMAGSEARGERGTSPTELLPCWFCSGSRIL